MPDSLPHRIVSKQLNDPIKNDPAKIEHRPSEGNASETASNPLPALARRWLFLGAWLLVVAAAVLCADRGWLPQVFGQVNRIPGADKTGHFVLIGILAWLANRALGYRTCPLGPGRVHLGGVIVLVLITLEEVSQIWIPTRTFDWGDLAANYAGILCAEILSRALRKPE